MILDVAHNAPAISVVLSELLFRRLSNLSNAKVILIFGAAQGKKVDEIMQTIRSFGNEKIAGVYLV